MEHLQGYEVYWHVLYQPWICVTHDTPFFRVLNELMLALACRKNEMLSKRINNEQLCHHLCAVKIKCMHGSKAQGKIRRRAQFHWKKHCTWISDSQPIFVQLLIPKNPFYTLYVLFLLEHNAMTTNGDFALSESLILRRLSQIVNVLCCEVINI